jgi:hypothetical protein
MRLKCFFPNVIYSFFVLTYQFTLRYIVSEVDMAKIHNVQVNKISEYSEENSLELSAP